MTTAVKNPAIRLEPKHAAAIALDFDGVCKLFTEHKHQIMSTLLFLHFPEFQQVPMGEYKKAYGYINFRSQDYAGKARFICVNALAAFLASEKGYKCRLAALDRAIKKLNADGIKVNAASLKPFDAEDEIKRVLAWSAEVDRKVSRLTGIGLTPGIKEYLLDAFVDSTDFYLVSTATEDSIRGSMEREGIFFIRRYFGQETAGKAEALSILVNAGYKNVFMFGDSVEDQRASEAAKKNTPPGTELVFVPVIPEKEEFSFEKGAAIINDVMTGNTDKAFQTALQLEKLFAGNEAGSSWNTF
ncbi:MAG: hypothetical protein WCS27_12370 [Victivallaceae bacterium]